MGSGAVEPAEARPARLHDAYRAVFVAHRARLVRLALLLGCDSSQVDDAVADAFARVFPHWVDGRVTDPGPYLRRTLVNELVHGGRRLGVQQRWGERNRAVERSDPLDGGVVERHRLGAALAVLPLERSASATDPPVLTRSQGVGREYAWRSPSGWSYRVSVSGPDGAATLTAEQVSDLLTTMDRP